MTLDSLWYGDSPAGVRALATLALGPPSVLLSVGARLRNALYDRGLLPVTRVDGLQVVSVGNLVVGGAGKTPLVIFLARWARASGRRVAVLTRGYGRATRTPLDFDDGALPPELDCGDEPRLIARKAPGVRVFVDADRVRAAHLARARGFEVALVDDGFQHRRLARDVDVLVEVTGAAPYVMPRGPYREPRSGSRRATVRWNGPAPEDPAGRLVVERLVDAHGAPVHPRRVFALTGIARPSRFTATLEALGLEVVGARRFADHHRFRVAELEAVAKTAGRLGATLVTTEKDRERLPGGFAAVTVETRLEVTRGLPALARVLGWPQACAPVGSMEEGPP